MRRTKKYNSTSRPNLKKWPFVAAVKIIEELEAFVQRKEHIINGGMRLGICLLSYCFHVAR